MRSESTEQNFSKSVKILTDTELCLSVRFHLQNHHSASNYYDKNVTITGKYKIEVKIFRFTYKKGIIQSRGRS